MRNVSVYLTIAFARARELWSQIAGDDRRATAQAVAPLAGGGFGFLGFAIGNRRGRPVAILAAIASLAAAAAIRRSAAGDDVSPNAELLEKATAHAEQGRKLAIYDRQTGLLAYWFLALRCDEECARTSRYGGPAALLVAECDPRSAADIVSAARAFTASLRLTDIVGYVGNARFVAVLPSTPPENVWPVVDRLTAAGFVAIGMASCPADGRSFDKLYREAAARLAPVNAAPLDDSETLAA